MEKVNLNGTLLPASDAAVSVFDHGLLYGDGLFETLRVTEGGLFRLDAHLRRLAEGAEVLRMELPWPVETLADAVRETVRANGVGEGMVRLTVTRGAGPPVPELDVCETPCFFVLTRPAPPVAEHGLSVCVSGVHPRPRPPRVKSLSYLPFLMARRKAKEQGFDEGLLTDGDRVVEGSVSNVFLVEGGRLMTPGLESGCLPGITRAAVLELAAAAGIPCLEAAVTVDHLRHADELFLTGAGLCVAPVVRFEDRVIGDGLMGTITAALGRAYRDLVAREREPVGSSKEGG
jgi:branched-chain amino acid aminotransferase